MNKGNLGAFALSGDLPPTFEEMLRRVVREELDRRASMPAIDLRITLNGQHVASTEG